MGLSLLLVMFFVRTFALEPFQIPAKSMYPALEPGDFVVVNKLGYGNYKFFGTSVLQTPLLATVRRGDILVFEYPGNPDLSYIKVLSDCPETQSKRSTESITSTVSYCRPGISQLTVTSRT